MKKTILAVCMSALAFFCQAQENSALFGAVPEHGKWGIKQYARGSLGMATILGEHNGTSIPRFSFNVGYGVVKNLTPHWAVEGAVNLSMKGYMGKQEIDIYAKHIDVKHVGTSWNLEIVPQGRYVKDFGFGEYSIGFGPYLGIGLGGKYSIKNSTTDDVPKYDYYGKSNGIRRCDFGVAYDIRCSFNRYLCGLQFMNGLMSVAKGSNHTNFGFWFYGGYFF